LARRRRNHTEASGRRRRRRGARRFAFGLASFYGEVGAHTKSITKLECQAEMRPDCDSAVRREIEAGKDRDAKMAAILDGLPRAVERLSEAQAAERQRSNEELSEWRGWRKGIDTSMQEARDTKGEVGRLVGRADAQDQRSSRIFDTLSADMAALRAAISVIDKNVAVIMERDARTPKRQSAPPMLLNPSPPETRFAARVIKRMKSKRRSTVQTVGLTRALERTFGRPYFRGPYWASLTRWGRRRP
jgi:hypothetical protein